MDFIAKLPILYEILKYFLEERFVLPPSKERTSFLILTKCRYNKVRLGTKSFITILTRISNWSQTLHS